MRSGGGGGAAASKRPAAAAAIPATVSGVSPPKRLSAMPGGGLLCQRVEPLECVALFEDGQGFDYHGKSRNLPYVVNAVERGQLDLAQLLQSLVSLTHVRVDEHEARARVHRESGDLRFHP